PQAGILEGGNPVAYNASNPVLLFIIQAIIIIIFCRLLHWPLSYLNQPRVIAEVIGGILLGPSVMMRIPGFQNAIFPTASMPILNNVANLGLIIFLFLVGLEVDVRLLTSNWRVALTVGLAGMAIPFGLGIAIAKGLYEQFRVAEADVSTDPIEFGVYALFIGTALAITAFPVLCRILTDLNLLGTSVGVTVLAAGIGNDVTGWILLALCVALVNNATGLAALWALLCVVGWALFLCYAVRPCFIWCLRRTGSLEKGPTQGMVALTLGIALVSAWFTGIIGVHPIFGAFLAGLICPHEAGFAIKLTEKIEDIVTVLFLPLYFALSGLSTNLGLLNDGITWAYVVGVIAVAFSGKIIGGTLAARFNRLEWRESLTIGCLMSCKGLVELIVLNVGLQAKILSERTFTIFVVMALVTTVSTTPLVKWLYPPWYQAKMERFRRGETDRDGNPINPAGGPSTSSHGGATMHEGDEGDGDKEWKPTAEIRRLLVYLRLDSLPGLFTFIALLGADGQNQDNHDDEDQRGSESYYETTTATTTTTTPRRRRPLPPLEVHGLRILELTERNSSVMQLTEGEGGPNHLSARDPVVNTFRAFSRLLRSSYNNIIAASGRVAVVPAPSYAETLARQAADIAADFVFVPWGENDSSNFSDRDTTTENHTDPASSLVLDGAAARTEERFASRSHLDFIHQVLHKPACNTGVFINRGLGGLLPPVDSRKNNNNNNNISSSNKEGGVSVTMSSSSHSLSTRDNKTHHQIFVPFLGGVDDRVALRFALRLARNPNVTLTVGAHSTSVNNNKVVEGASAQDMALLSSLSSSPPQGLAGRFTIAEVDATRRTAVAEAVARARAHVGNSPQNAGDLVVVGRSHVDLGDGVVEVDGGDLRRTVGVVAQQFVDSGIKASLLVIRAGGAGLN
ncbi:hypothetical protein M406DRAFT_216239, partial [Cryphonectria parasitica EP155]